MYFFFVEQMTRTKDAKRQIGFREHISTNESWTMCLESDSRVSVATIASHKMPTKRKSVCFVCFDFDFMIVFVFDDAHKPIVCIMN